MKRFFLWLISRQGIILIGLVILSLVIWFEGPLLSYDKIVPLDSIAERFTLIAVLVAAVFLIWLWRILLERWNARKLAQVVAGQAGEGQSEAGAGTVLNAEISALASRMQVAIQTLEKSDKRRGMGGAVLYQLPWYLFIGAPGSGKTTALTHSGLRFPFSESLGSAAIGGIGGTRNCDWWFTDEAVMLDTAGRYTTQDSLAEQDSAAWKGFLGLLLKVRKRKPINGVIIAISVADLLQKDGAARSRLAQSIRGRIKELHEMLGIRFPIYVMVTKCDLLAGFMAYFDQLSSEEKGQVWGLTFPVSTPDRPIQVLELFPSELHALERQLQAQVLARMQQEPDLQRRALIYGLPQQFASLEATLYPMLQEIFQTSHYEENPLLRGVYFTSGTQEGNPIDRVIGSLATAFGLDRRSLPANVASGRSYFVTNTLRQVIFPEAGLAGENLRFERERKFFMWGSVTVLALVLVLVLGARVVSFFGNRALLDELDQRTMQLEKITRSDTRSDTRNDTSNASLPELLPLLNAARALPTGYAARDKTVPLLMRLGLYQGKHLTPATMAVYQRLLQQALLPQLVERLEDQLRRAEANNPDYFYEALRMYLMLGDRKHFDADTLQAWFELDFSKNLPEADESMQAALASHLAALLEMGQGQESALSDIDVELVTQSRLVLARQALPQRLYFRLKRAMAREALAEFSINSAGGQGASLLFQRRSGEPMTRGVAGMYTVAGYRKFVERTDQLIANLALDNWVLGKQEAITNLADIEQTKMAVQNLYFADYVRHWDDFLQDISLLPFASLDEGARLVQAMVSADSPLRKLLQGIAQETRLEAVRFGILAPDSVVKALRGKLDDYKKQFEQALGTATPAPPVNKVSNPVDAHFHALHLLVGVSGASATPLDAILSNLKELAVYFEDADRARRAGAAIPAPEAMLKLRRIAQDQAVPLAGLLLELDALGSGIAQGSDRVRLNAVWAASALFCKQAIAGRYPLVRSSSADILADDFGKFFAPGGLLDDFFQKNLAQHVDMAEQRWRWRPASALALGVGTEVLADFQRGAQIRDMFFPAAARLPSMRFGLKPVTMDAALSEMVLDVDGQILKMESGVDTAAVLMVLPSGKRNGQVRFQTTPTGAQADPKADGPWAWLRLLDGAQVELTAQGERFRVHFDLAGRKLSLDMIASSVINPFRRDALEQFHCPDRL